MRNFGGIFERLSYLIRSRQLTVFQFFICSLLDLPSNLSCVILQIAETVKCALDLTLQQRVRDA